jgi:Ala-tRNA(Pro) deacylase
MALESLTRFLDDAGASYEVLPHARTESAVAEAEALGLPPHEVAKTLVVETPDGNVRAVLLASERIDLQKLGELHGDRRKEIHLLSEEQLGRDYPDFELGAVPPLGGSHADRVIVDRRIADRPSIVLEAGSHDESIRLQTADLIRLAGAEVADISID